MKIRTIAVATGLCFAVLTGCGSSVAGQAQIASGAVLPPTSKSAPAPFPDPSSSESTGTSSTASEATTSESTQDSQVTENTPTQQSSSTGSDDSSVGPTSATSIPGLSKDCNTVLAAITAFSGVLQGAGTSDKISQATVDTALQQLPASGLPTRPQADVTVLRETVTGAVGQSLIELGQTMADGKVVAALKDLSSWAQDNCA